MSLSLGSSLASKVYLGATEIKGAYLGATQVYTSFVSPLNKMSNAVFAIGSDVALDGYSEDRVDFEYHPENGSKTDLTVSASLGGIDMDGASTAIYTDSNTDGFTDSFSSMIISRSGTGSMQQMLLARFSDTTLSGYSGRVLGGKIEIGRWDNGSFTPLVLSSSASTIIDGNYSLDLSVVGNQITCTLSGPVNMAESVTDSTYTSGRTGLRGTSSPGTVISGYESAEIDAGMLSTALRTTSLNAHGWYDDGADMVSQNTGNSFTLSFNGTYLGISTINKTGITGYLGVSFDGGNSYTVHKLAAGLQERTLYSNPDVSAGEKTARIVLLGNDSVADNWSVPANGLEVRYIITDAGDIPATPPSRSSDPIVLVGDSIVRGRSLKAENLRYGDSTKTWGWKIAENLNKEAIFIAFSGQGASNGGAGGVPAAKTAINSYYNGVARPVDTSVQNVFVAHGTNDGNFSESVIKADHTTLWTNARILYPNAKIWVILPLGYSANNETPSAIDRRDEINGWILSAFTAWADGNSDSIDLTGNVYGNSMPGPLQSGNPNQYTVGDQIHPNEATHQLIYADILTAIS